MNITESPPNTTYSDQSFVGEPLSLAARVLLLTLGWLACVTGVFGNVLIVITLLSQHALRSVHNIYIANLAVADLLVVGYVLVFWLLDLALGHQPVANHFHCAANGFILVVTFTVSIYTLAVISFDRYLSVCHNSVYAKVFSLKTTIASCVALWIIGSMEAFVPLSGGAAYVYKKDIHICSFVTEDPRSVNSILAVMNLFVPTVLVGFFSVSILRFWKKQKTRVGQWAHNTNQKPKLKICPSDVALIRSLILVFALLVILYVPLAVAMAIDRSVEVSANVHTVLLFFFLLNSSINWIVYGLMNKNFRNGYKRLIYGCNHGHHNEHEGTGHSQASH